MDFVSFQFLQDILDTLFVILDDNTEKYGLLVFQSLVSMTHFWWINAFIFPLFWIFLFHSECEEEIGGKTFLHFFVKAV